MDIMFMLELEEFRKKHGIVCNCQGYEYKVSHYKTSANGILSYMKRKFGVTPYALKNQIGDLAINLRQLALYLLANATYEDIDAVAQQFEVSVQELQFYVKNDDIQKKYEKEIYSFYEPIIM